MSLCDARIGLGAQLSPTAMKIIECYIDFDKILLEQRMMQSQVAGEGAKGSGESAYEDKMAQAAVTAARQKQYQAALDIAAAKAALGAARGRAEAADKEAFKAERALLKVNAEELTMPSMPTQEPKR